MFQHELQRPRGCVVSISETKRFITLLGGATAWTVAARAAIRPGRR
jgi:hypothetical protein